jgi:formylglycine-generating enzyme required for sulfatase activity
MVIRGVELVELKPGFFRMGSFHRCEKGDLPGRLCSILHLPWGTRPRPRGDEWPAHWVELSYSFWIARTEVTNKQYEEFDPEHRRCEYWGADDDPVVDVSWLEAREYCAWLSSFGGLTIRLPGEAEWEFAARAGSMAEYCFGDDGTGLGSYGWYRGNSGGSVHAVGTRLPNAWGLFDLHGNVWEWCEDAYFGNYEGAPSDGRVWTSGGRLWRTTSERVYRGGGCQDLADWCRASSRDRHLPAAQWMTQGFRPVGVQRGGSQGKE